ncbi:hypothetical protein GGX14DRAFT_328226, partial [Mycena pura]
YDNPAIYGQANSWYSTHPTVKGPHDTFFQLTLTQKFEPYFADEIQRSWEAFLGPLANEDPHNSDVPRKTWEEVLQWILESGLKGFGSGLGTLQFANNAVLCGIADGPSPAAMASWISANKTYGAFTGLQVVGFNLPPNASPAIIRAAFLCFYYWLEHCLSPEDRAVLHFDTIFAEQLLCKIGRWRHRMQTMGKIDLVAEAQKLFEGLDWQKGANLNDPSKFPIPSFKD